jgi:hypothetical protein
MVLLAAAAVCAPAVAQKKAMAPPTQIEVAPVERLSKAAPFPVGWEDDVYCTGWIGSAEEPVTGRIVAAEYEDSRTMYATGDIVYADVGAADGLVAGQEFQVIRPAHTVYKVDSVLDTIGRFYETPGRVKVVCVQEKTAILEFTESCTPSQIGDLLIPFEPIPIPLVRASAPYTQCDPPSGKTTGRIVETKDRAVPVGTDTVVFLDLGEADGVFPGDFLSVWRPRADAALGLRTMLGEVGVLWTKEHTCVAKVTSMIDTMGVGDFVELK